MTHATMPGLTLSFIPVSQSSSGNIREKNRFCRRRPAIHYALMGKQTRRSAIKRFCERLKEEMLHGATFLDTKT